jgi:hypothetical protein
MASRYLTGEVVERIGGQIARGDAGGAAQAAQDLLAEAIRLLDARAPSDAEAGARVA